MKLPTNWMLIRNHSPTINSTIIVTHHCHKNIHKIYRNYCRPHQRLMWFRVQRWKVPTHITINCCIFTRPELRDCQKRPLSRIRGIFSLRPASITWPISSRRTYSTRRCHCIIRLVVWWALVKHCYSAQRLSFAKSSPPLAIFPIVKSINAPSPNTLAKCVATFWPRHPIRPIPITLYVSSLATDFDRRFGHSLSIASKLVV